MSEDCVSPDNVISDSQHQPGGGYGASPIQISRNPAANAEPQRSQNSEDNLLGLDGVSALTDDLSDAILGGGSSAAVEPSSSIPVDRATASSEPLLAVSTAGYLSAAIDAAVGNIRSRNFLPPLPPFPGQSSIAGNGVKLSPAPRVVGSSVINKSEPPRGIDPSRHHRDAAANLAAAAKMLSGPGSLQPKVLNPPMMRNSSTTVQSPATGSPGPEAAHSQGSSRTRIHLRTPDFLTAVADNFFSLPRILQMQ